MASNYLFTFNLGAFLPFFLLATVFSLTGCGNENKDTEAAISTQYSDVEGLIRPESAYTMQDGSIFISEIGEFNPKGKDGDGKIVKITPDGTKTIIADSGLNDPKGLLVEGSTIYVTDNQEVKKVTFDGEVTTWLKKSDFPVEPQFLNDITIDRNTIIYISDSGDFKKDGAIFRVDSAGKVVILADKANSPKILAPNGLSTFQRGFLFVTDFSSGDLLRINLKNIEVEKLSGGFGAGDGLVFSGTNLYISDWKGGKIWSLDVTSPGNKPSLLKDGYVNPADIDVTPDGKYLVIPEMKPGKIRFLPL
jgi:sugar lactone lactonase YvrE